MMAAPTARLRVPTSRSVRIVRTEGPRERSRGPLHLEHTARGRGPMIRLLAVLVALSSAARAEEVWPEFPKKGQVVPMGTLGISYATAGGSSQTQVQIAPTLLYLAGDHFVAGGDLVYRSLSTSGSSTTQSATGVDLMLGGAFTLGPRMSILLLPAVGFLSLSAGSSS